MDVGTAAVKVYAAATPEGRRNMVARLEGNLMDWGGMTVISTFDGKVRTCLAGSVLPLDTDYIRLDDQEAAVEAIAPGASDFDITTAWDYSFSYDPNRARRQALAAIHEYDYQARA